MNFKIIFEDDEILVIDKPAGLVTLQTETTKEATLSDILKSKFSINLERAGVVHRLDKDTSGVLVVAKTKDAFENLQSQFKQRLVKKEYIALVHGVLTEKRFVNASIGRNPGNREKFIVLEGGKEAITEFNPIKQFMMSDEFINKTFADFSKIQIKKLYAIHYTLLTLVRCLPLTGRTHQIRVHLKYINLPIVADNKYGGRKMTRLDHRFCSRQFLHASKLTLNYPVTGEVITFESPLPEDLKQVLSYLT